MEVQCPKCHFIQPKDQYCARCGIDMQKYKPQSTSLLSKLNVQTAILFLVAMSVLGLTIFIFRKDDKPLTNTFTQYSAVKSNRALEKSEPVATEPDAYETAVASSDTDESKPETVDLKVEDQGLLDQFSGESKKAEAASSAEFSNPRIKISFVEINLDQLNAMLAESQNQGLLQRDGDDFKGIIPNISYLAQYRYKTLKQEVKEMRPNQIEAFFFGKTSTESSQFVGVQMNLEKKSADGSENKWVLTSNISRTESKETETHEMTMNKNSAFFMSAKTWIMRFESERMLADTPPFSSLTSPDLLNQRSEIIVLLEIY